MGFRVVLSDTAESDLEGIVRYISQDNSPSGARIGRAIVAHFRILESSPRLGRRVPEFRTDTLREIVHRPYRLIYKINDAEQVIEVVRIWHAARGTPEIDR